MNYQRLLETLDKAETGPIHDERDFDRVQIGAAIKEVLKRFNISWPMVLATAPSGIAHVEGVHTATGRFESHCTPLEVRFMAEVAHAAEKLSRLEADGVVKRIVKKYEEKHRVIHEGKSFAECYDLDSLTPAREWQEMYDVAGREMEAAYGLRI